jgi:hypothetical protein
MTQYVSVFIGMTSVSLAESCYSDQMMRTATALPPLHGLVHLTV